MAVPTLLKFRIFHDEERKLIGFKPSEDGYKISHGGNVYRVKCSYLSKIITGEFYPKWSEKQKMLIFSYKDRNL